MLLKIPLYNLFSKAKVSKIQLADGLDVFARVVFWESFNLNVSPTCFELVIRVNSFGFILKPCFLKFGYLFVLIFAYGVF